jgi:hypothetical protein
MQGGESIASNPTPYPWKRYKVSDAHRLSRYLIDRIMGAGSEIDTVVMAILMGASSL